MKKNCPTVLQSVISLNRHNHRQRLYSFLLRSSVAVLLGSGLTLTGVALAQTPESFRTAEFRANWGLGAIGAEYAYALGYTGAGIKLGIADGIFQFTHPEFSGRIYDPEVFPAFPIPGVKVPDHGTHVMGLAAAARNDTGMMGVAFNAQLAGVGAYNEPGYPPAGDWAGELIKAGVSVMNGSFGPDAVPKPYFDDGTENPNYREVGFQVLGISDVREDLSAIQRLSKADVVMVFAAGNDYEAQPVATRFPLGAGMIPLITPERTRAQQPGCSLTSGGLYCFVAETDATDPNNPSTWTFEPVANVEHFDGSPYAGTLIAVVALDKNLKIASFSNRCGEAADWCIAAPGVDLLSSVPMSTYGNMSGTSMAAPLVAGSAAVLRQAFPYMTARQIIEVLLTTATDLGNPALYGHGLLNLGKAIKGPARFGTPSLIPGNASIFPVIFAVDTQGYNSEWSNDISGPGGMSKAGAGRLTLSGRNTYLGDTTVTGGTLRVDGSLEHSFLTVESGAVLEGRGTVNDVLMRGTLSPGNSVGTLTVNGDLEFANGSVYLFEVNDLRQTDLLMVRGATTIEDGAAFKLRANDGVLLDTPYTIIDSNAISGTFTTPDANFTFIDLAFVIDGDDLLLDIDRNNVPMAAYAQTNNQRAVANAIDAQSPGDEPYNEVLLNDNPGVLADWYQNWSGEIYSANKAALLNNSRLLTQIVNWRLMDSRLEHASATRLQQIGQRNSDTAVWAQAYGNWDRFNANADAKSASANSGGFILGLDHALTPTLRLGGGLSASQTNTTVAASNAATDGYHLMLYGAYTHERIHLNGGLVQSWYTTNVNRTLSVDDLGNPKGSVSSSSTQLFLDASSPIKLQTGTTLSPFAQLSQIWLNTSSFSESGAEASLTGASSRTSVGFGTLGARLQHEWTHHKTAWQATLSAGWQRGWGDLSPSTSLAFSAGPSFTVNAAPIARDAAVIEVGIGASLGPSSRFNLVYSATLSGQSSNQMLQAQLQWRF